MRVNILPDAGPTAGLGHLRRCLALAHALKLQGAAVTFLVPAGRSLAGRLTRAGFGVRPLPHDAPLAASGALPDADALVIDSYRLTPEEMAGLRPPAGILVCFDDLADHPLPADLVVNGALGAAALPYRGLRPRQRFLLGPRYLALAPSFAGTPPRPVRATVREVLITTGGSDPEGAAASLLAIASRVPGDFRISMVEGPLYPAASREAVRRLAAEYRDRIRIVRPRNPRHAMHRADLAIAGGGVTLYELAALGTPTLAVELAANQAVNLAGLSQAGVIAWAGATEDTHFAVKFESLLKELLADREWRHAMSRAGQALVDGRGAERLARQVLELASRRDRAAG